MKLANRRNPTSPKGQKGKFAPMFNRIKNLFKNSKKNQIKKLSLIVEELRGENDARANEIYELKKALQECEDKQVNFDYYDVEDIENRVDDLEYNIDDKAEQSDLENLEESIEDLSARIEQVEQKQSLEDVEEIDAKINQLKQVKSELKAMFKNIADALED